MCSNESYISSLSSVFKGDFSTDQLMPFMNETISFFQNLQKGLESKDQVVKGKAVEDMMQIQSLLEENIEMICKKTGLNLSELIDFSQNSENLTPEQLQEVEKLTEHFKSIQGDVLNNAQILNNKNIG